MRPSAATVLAAALLLAACGRPDVTSYRVPKGSSGEAPAGAAHEHGGRAAALRWSVPKGWREKAPSSMRLASFDVPEKGGLCDASIVVLEGGAMGVLANVNRWRGQIGLPPLEGEKSLAETSVKVKTGAGEAVVVDLAGSDTRLLAAVLSRNGETWFVKLTGPAKGAASAKPAFLELVRSLRPS
ncbi:MAG TPA: hypothetical protein DCM05_14210 [Elusimicrobia bacterium]|nr:hypothetical protein [Elusimicrobiota bacterium]